MIAQLIRTRMGWARFALAALCFQAQAQVCGLAQPPTLQPQFAPVPIIQSDAVIDCFMWQTFVYLTWPAQTGQRGQPDTSASYGAPGPVVWETLKAYDEVFLTKAAVPAPWNNPSPTVFAQRNRLLKMNANRPGAVDFSSLRLLSSKNKLFRSAKSFALMRPIGKNATASGTMSLDELTQVDGHALYDQAGQPVYYEMLLNQTEFNYIVGNQLYNANTQAQFAKANGLALPPSSMEIKAAWKVLTPQELSAQPVRFFTAPALLGKSTQPVTVGLVGLHVLQFPSATSFYQGFWATFAQIDNAPNYSQTSSTRNWSFYNPSCTTSQCPINTPTASGVPTQVVNAGAVPTEIPPINAYMQNLIATFAPQSPGQFYQLLNVQWPNSAVPIGKPGQTAPLPNGTPNTAALTNPVLETFMQTNTKSCLGCHTGAAVPGQNNLASSYSFLMGHAQTPTAKSLKQIVRQAKLAP
jgi:hypothetical protein